MVVRLAVALLGGLALVGMSACGGPKEYGSDFFCWYEAPHRTGSSAHTFNVDRRIVGGHNSIIQWAPDGSRILFDYGVLSLAADPPSLVSRDVADLYAVHADGSRLDKIVDLPSRTAPFDNSAGTTYFDISPDGSRITYATCVLSKDPERGNRRIHNYEIFVSDLDGADVKRLTKNTHFDVLPAWSPDGESIAFIAGPPGVPLRLTVITVATGESRELRLPAAVAPFRLEWSPNGERIAFVAHEEGWSKREPRYAVYIVEADGSRLWKVSDVVSGPTWSPNGEKIAMAVPEGEYEEALYIFAADGSNPVKVDNLDRYVRMAPLSWSPDGSAILIEYTSRSVRPMPHIVYLDSAEAREASDPRTHVATAGAGGLVLRSPPADYTASGGRTIYPVGLVSAWSPDGSQIAVRIGGNSLPPKLYVIDRSGKRKDLVRFGYDDDERPFIAPAQGSGDDLENSILIGP